jgi:hypothetical protein
LAFPAPACALADSAIANIEASKGIDRAIALPESQPS